MIQVVRKTMIALSVAALPTTSMALTVGEYNGLSNEVQNRALSQIAVGTYKHLESQGASKEMLQCIGNFFSQQETMANGEAVKVVPGANNIIGQINSANAQDMRDIRIEEMVMGAINTQCGVIP